MSLISSTKPEQEITDFPWNNVTFTLNDDEILAVDSRATDAWNKYGFLIVKHLFSEETVQELEKCSKDPNIQVCYIHIFSSVNNASRSYVQIS